MSGRSRDGAGLYDDPDFLDGYRHLRRTGQGINDELEIPAMDAVLRTLPVAGARVVDLGCGEGGLAVRLAKAGAADVLAVDASQQMLAAAVQHPRVRYQRADLTTFDLPPGSADLVVSSMALHYVENLDTLLARTAHWLSRSERKHPPGEAGSPPAARVVVPGGAEARPIEREPASSWGEAPRVGREPSSSGGEVTRVEREPSSSGGEVTRVGRGASSGGGEGLPRAGGALVFSVEHPVMTAAVAVDCGVDDYADEGRRERTWFVEGVVKYHRTIGSIVGSLRRHGFQLELIDEPLPTREQAAAHPHLAIHRRRPPILLVAARRTS
ncbi:hypothetical protein GCM10009804_65130 [Kribbella hippodromi]|uniref:Methyltransferase domain-containing protein n=1 Tax=Kribbella hippodromi TaxID=434347 RepID=A0ABN2E9Z8_9ACTN